MHTLFTNRRVYFILSGGVSVCLLLMHPMLVAHSSTIVGENRTRVDAPIIYNRESAGSLPLVIQSQRNGQLWVGSTQLEIPSQRSGQSSAESLRLEIPSQRSQSAVESAPLMIPSQKSDQPSGESTPLATPSQVSDQPSGESTPLAIPSQVSNQPSIDPPQPATSPQVSNQSPVKRTQLAKTLPPSQASSQLPVKRTQLAKTQPSSEKSSQLPKKSAQSVIQPKEKGSLPIEAPKLATSARKSGRIPKRSHLPVISSHGGIRQNNQSFHGITHSAKPASLVGRKESNSRNQISGQRKRRTTRYRANNRVNRTPINRREVTVKDYYNGFEIRVNRWLATPYR